MTKNIKITLIVIAIIAIIGNFLPTGKSVVERVTEKLGAVPTLDGIDHKYVKINGVETAYVSQPINATSTMLCNIPNPYTSTTTVLSFSMRITDGILGANNLSVSTSSTYYGSSTPVFVLDHSVPSESTDSFAWQPGASTTNVRILAANGSPDGRDYHFLRSGEFLVVRLATTTGAGALGDYYDGVCSGVFQRQ